MKNIYIIIVLLFALNCYAQTDSNISTKAYPEIGWDSLSSLLQRPGNYPEIPRRAGVTASLSVYLIIDSTGKMLNVEPAKIPTNAEDSSLNRLFIPSIWGALRFIKWVPSKIDDKPINDRIYLLFNFNLYEPWERTFHILAPKYYEERLINK